LVQNNADKDEASLARAAYRRQLNDLAGAAEDVAVARELAPEADLHRAAAAVERWGQAAAAERLYRRFAERSKPPAGLLALAEYLGRQDRLDDALAQLDRARPACSPEQLALSCLVVLSKGARTEPHCRRMAGWLEEALNQAPAKSPTAELLGVTLGWVYSLQGRYPEAEERFRRALAQNAQQVEALNGLAALLALKDGKAGGEEALTLANRALEVLGPHPIVLETRAVAYLALGRPGPALDDLEEALARAPSPACWLYLARAHGLAGDRARAAAAWKKAQEAGLKPAHLHPLEQPHYQELAARLARE
jgi:tetratricopeptide (TPR) repeat protein